MAANRRVPSVMSATRLHFPQGTAALPEVSKQHLRDYAAQARDLGVSAAIAVNMLEDSVAAVVKEVAPSLQLRVLHVPIWGAFVPALNTLLGEAQRCGMVYVLYQSLEVCCTPDVLQKLMDHFTSDTLVVGPELDGHLWMEGEQRLHGRSTPWNTLALWSVRKLALTGFLSVAEGMNPTHREVDLVRMCTGDSDGMGLESPQMGSLGWWHERHPRQLSEASAGSTVPAGVEEVTAVALLQHLLGEDRARAVLLRLQSKSDAVTWQADWGQDERRKQWHEYKMASKIARPAMQVKQLFGGRGRGNSAVFSTISRPFLLPVMSGEWRAANKPQAEAGAGGADADPKLYFGKALHLGPSIRTSAHVEELCFAVIVLFNMNFASVFAPALRSVNTRSGDEIGSASFVAYITVLLCGVYFPMPFSLCLARALIARYRHIAGLVLFFSLLLLASCMVVVSQYVFQDRVLQQSVLLASRVTAGLGSGVLFQCRYVLVTTSTYDNRSSLLFRGLQASDLGVVVGALLPGLLNAFVGRAEIDDAAPEMLPSACIALLSAICLARVLLVFPRRLFQLPKRIQMQGRPDSEVAQVDGGSAELSRRRTHRWLLFAGTTRHFVQTAIMVSVALVLRDMGVSTHFRQTYAIACLCSLPVVSRACVPLYRKVTSRASVVLASLAVLAVPLRIMVTQLLQLDIDPLVSGAVQLYILIVALAVASPAGESLQYQSKDPEGLLVQLEWMKAFIGRCASPFFAAVAYHVAGPDALTAFLGILCIIATSE